MEIGIIIQARTGSTRLPGKVISPFYHNQSILEIIIRRILNQYDKKSVVLATTNNSSDDGVALLGMQLGVLVFRGSENDVLSRFTEVVSKFRFDGVIRVCADNPFLDVDSFKDLIKFNAVSNSDYTGFCLSDGTPTIMTHFGLWAEFVSGKALVEAATRTSDKLFIEHVTNFIYENPQLFKVDLHLLPEIWLKEKNIRFTLDSQEDFDLLQTIYAAFMENGISMTPTNLLNYVKDNPHIENEMEKQIDRWQK